MADLSEYEKVRLENIRRNEAFLSSIGISEVKPASSANYSSAEKKKAREKKERRKSIVEPRVAAAPSRRSKRLRGQTETTKDLELSDEEEVEVEVEEGDGGIDYESDPLGPENLDDYEFEVFVAAKAWRLAKCRALDTEPYKIFNNRAMCDVIRRRRNDEKWALYDRNDLLQAWGTAEKKLSTGVPIELIEVLEEKENARKLEASRKLGAPE